MNSVLRIRLNVSPEQIARLRALQGAFAEVCNALAPLVRDSRCWNRVALHHMAYRDLRQRFPQMGSQMICNAIYSVSRTCRAVFQGPRSPFNVARWGERPLPLLTFVPTAPVYFDRHTLSIRAGRLSMFTLDGRMKFDLALSPADERRFHEEKLREVVLQSTQEQFSLTFVFGGDDSRDEPRDDPREAQIAVPAVTLRARPGTKDLAARASERAGDDNAIPEYVHVAQDAPATDTGAHA